MPTVVTFLGQTALILAAMLVVLGLLVAIVTLLGFIARKGRELSRL
jgi:hypothetical protein